MVTGLRFFNIPPFLALALLLGAAPAFSAEVKPAIEFKGLYQCGVGGMQIAKFGIEVDETATSYDVTSDILSTGMLKLFVKHSSHSTTSKQGDAVAYETHYQTNKKPKYVSLKYEHSIITGENVLPPDNRDKRPAVSTELKKNTVDPLSLIVQMRLQLIDALKNKKPGYTINVYDGRRLTQVDFTVVGERDLKIGDDTRKTIVVTVKRKAIAGFSESEIKSQDPHEPLLTIYFSNDERLWPLKLEVPMMLGSLSATLVKECRTGESCLLGLKE